MPWFAPSPLANFTKNRLNKYFEFLLTYRTHDNTNLRRCLMSVMIVAKFVSGSSFNNESILDFFSGSGESKYDRHLISQCYKLSYCYQKIQNVLADSVILQVLYHHKAIDVLDYKKKLHCMNKHTQ